MPETRITHDTNGLGVNLTLLNVAIEQLIDREGVAKILEVIAHRLADELIVEARQKVLGTGEAVNTVFNMVTIELVKRLSAGEDYVKKAV